MIPSRLLLCCFFTVVISKSLYICGPEGYRFDSDVPCNFYPTCSNGGFKLFVGCQNDTTCSLYSPASVCVDQMCCTGGVIVVKPVTTRP